MPNLVERSAPGAAALCHAWLPDAEAVHFNYSTLPAAVRDDARAAAARIKDRLRANIAQTGEDLIKVKAAIGHGAFGQWISAEFRFTNRTAESYMNAARFLAEKCETLSYLPPTVIYALSAPSAPEEVVRDVVAAAEAGHLPEPAQIKAAIAAAIKADKLAKIEAAKSLEQIAKEKRVRASKLRRVALAQVKEQRERAESDQERRDRDERLDQLATRIITRVVASDITELTRAMDRWADGQILLGHLRQKMPAMEIAADTDSKSGAV